MSGSTDTLVVISKLSFSPKKLDGQAAAFLEAIRETILKTGAEYAGGALELVEIGFVPQETYIELRLYFRRVAMAGTLI